MKTQKSIAIAADHAGFDYKDMLKKHLLSKGFQVLDFGTFDKQSTDYPDYVHPLATAIEQKQHDLGILICGSANGVCMTANKHQQIRAAICWNVELAQLARQHNNANIICLPARFVSQELAIQMTDAFLETEFEGGRHQVRVDKISC